jgi:sugar lactone lactonase YvrE
VSNQGNLPIGAGNLELTVTLLDADTAGGPPHIEAGTPLVSGGLLNQPVGGGFDAQGNFYTVNRGDARVLKVAPDGQTTIVTTLPGTLLNPTAFFSPVDSVTDADGNLYVLNNASEIWKVAPTGTLTRIRTNLNGQATFDRDASGAFFIITTFNGAQVIRQQPGGAQTLWNAQGVGSPWGIARGTDGNLYVTDRFTGSVARVAPDGVVTNVVTDGTVLRTPQGITLGPDGNFYIANSGAANVIRMTPAGALSVYGTGLNGPTDLSFDSQGALFVSNATDNTVARIPPGGGAAQTFARTLVTSPQGMAYDAAGNLFVTGFGQLVKLDPSDNATVLSTSISSGRGVAVGPSGDVYVANGGPGTITRTVGGTTTTFASGFTSTGGLVFGPGGLLYAPDGASQVNRIYSLDANGTKSVVAESLITDPKDIHVAPNGDRYVLNGQYIAWTSGAGGPVNIFVRGGLSAQSFAPAGDGGFFVTENTAVKRVSATGAVTTIKASLPFFLSHGVVPEASGTLLLGDNSNRRIVRMDAAGNTTIVAQLTENPNTLVDDLAGGVYVGTSSGSLFRVTAAGVVTKLNTTSVNFVNRMSLDAVGNRMYLSDGTSVRVFNLATNALVPGVLASISGTAAIEFSGNALLVVNVFTLELQSVTPQGQVATVLAGFNAPAAIASDGTKLYFSDSSRVFSLVPGGYPQIVATRQINHLTWRDGTLYATAGSTVLSMRPGIDAAFATYFTLSGTLRGLAFRPDGALSMSSETDHRVVTIDAAKQVVASYAGINGAAGIAVDASGNVFMSSQTNGEVLRIAPSGKQSSVFSSGLAFGPLTFDANGVLHAAAGAGNGARVIRFDATGGQTVVATSTSGSSPRGLSVSAGGIFVSESNTTNVFKASGATLTAFTGGVQSPRAARLDASGNLFIAAQGNASVAKFVPANGSVTTVTPGVNLGSVGALAFAPDGTVLAGSQSFNGALWAIDPSTGVTTDLGSLLTIFGASGNVNALARNPITGVFHVVDTASPTRIDRITYVTPPTPPALGSVVLTRTATFGGLATDSLPTNVDFGSWVPPYGGDFRLGVRVAGGTIAGEAANVLHVGPYATGTIVPAKATLPPGDSALNVAVNLVGADFTTLSRVDPTNISVAVSTGVFPSAMGPDASGNIYVTTSGDNRLRRFSPAGVATDVFVLPAGQTVNMRGMVPVDDAQNAYMSGGSGNRDVIRVAPGGAGTTVASLPEAVVSLARASGDVIYALSSTSIYRIPPQGGFTRLNIPAFGSAFALSVDGRDNLYVQFTGNIINKYQPDGTVTNVVRPGATGQPTFEYEGMNISGDCADNLFVTPNLWDVAGQSSGEEFSLVQVVGRTGKVAQVLNGRTVNPQLTDLDFIVYDRFTGSLLMWTDVSGGRMYRIPVTCGAISTDLHLVFPAGRTTGGFSLAPKATLPRADGSSEYVWSLKDVTAFGTSLGLSTTFKALKLGDVVPVASEAFLVFQNTFVPGDIKVPLAIPTIGVDGMVDIAVLLDKPQYEANTDVLSAVRLANRDAATAKTGVLTVEVTDPQGTRLAIAAQQGVTIPASSTLEVTPPFNTASFLTGTYVMKATLADASGVVLATGATSFDIVAGPVTLISSVTTDKASYEAFDRVAITSRVRNVSLNAIASDTTTQVTVKDPAGQPVLSGSSAIAILVPQALKDSPFTLKLNAAAAGTYVVEEKLLDATSHLLETRTATFTVLSSADTGSGLRGAVTATKLANVGDPVTVTVALKNQGNAALANLPLVIRIVNPATGSLVQQWTSTVSIEQGAQQQAVQVWTSAGAAGVYIASAVATVGGRDIALGQDAFTLGAIQPFAFAPKANVPLNALIESDPATIAGIVAPAPISVANGEYRVGNGGWNGAPGFVSPGDTVSVRLYSAGAFNTTSTAVLTVAGFAAPFSVTTLNPDVSPDPFGFAPQVNVPLASLRVSNEATIAGIDIAVPVSIAGGEYSVNGGAFTSAAGTVVAGDKVQVRQVSAATLGTTTTATLTVSDFSAPFNVTTTAEDRTPDPIVFTPQNNVPVSSLRTSNTVTVTGINVAVPISVAGGEYSINGGAFTSTPGTVSSGTTVTVRHTSSASFSTTVTTKLTVSDLTANFESSTEGEDRTPEPFAFNEQVDVPLTSVRSSNAVTITGINTTVPVTVAGGEYSVNGGAFTAAAGTVKSNDVVIVRQTSAATFATKSTATLTVAEFAAPFAVTTKSAADVSTLPTFPADGRVLVLLSCKAGFVEAADDDPACLEERRAFLDAYLTQLGVIHTIVTTTEDFRAEMRSGRYNTYWISGGALKLKDTLPAEVREATFRGESLIVDGVHDQRNAFLDEALGVFYKGKPTGLATVTVVGGLLPPGAFDVNGARPIRVELIGSVPLARFNTGDPAISAMAFGLGKSLLYSFDMTGTLLAQSASALLRDTLDASLDWVTPAVPSVFTGGAYVPVTLAFRNAEPVAVDLDVTSTLPAGFALAAGAPPAIATGSQVEWQVALAAGATKSIDWAVRTPDASGSYAIPLVVKQVYAGTSVQLATPSIPIEVRALDATLPAVIAQLQALPGLTASERNARDRAVSSLFAAQAAINGTRWAEAIADLVDAVDLVNGISSVPTAAYQAAIDNVLKEAERRWWSALPPCPSASPCRVP